ncbi:MAG TPA: chlorite dismutase family protein [bacterium]
MAGQSVNGPQAVQVLTLRVDPLWRRLPDEQRETGAAAFRAAAETAARTAPAVSYSMIGVRRDADLLLFRTAPALLELEETAALLLRSGMGRYCTVAHSFIGLIRPSRYVKTPTAQEQAIFGETRGAYLVVYPFTKTHDWYRLSRDARQGMMSEHIRIGHDFPQIRQLLAYSTGLDDQEFIVAYDTDDLAAFQDLVIALRETEARRFTLSDQPILTAVHRPLADALRLLG